MRFLWFGKKEPKKTLEQLAIDVLTAEKIRIDPSFKDPNYHDYNIIGIGDSENDSDGALEHFKYNLVNGRNGLPEVVSRITEYFTPIGGRKKAVCALGYKLKPRNIA